MKHSIPHIGLMLSLLALAAVMVGCGDVDQARQQAESGEVVDGSVDRDDLKVKPRWQPLLTLRGSKAKRSETFKVKGNNWKISWKTTPASDDDEFIIILYDKHDEDVSEIIANTNGAEENFIYLEGRGEYYLSVNTTQKFEVKVEEQR